MTKKDLTAGFFGDSIFYGYQTDYESRCFRVFEKESGIRSVFVGRENPLGFPGAGLFRYFKNLPLFFVENQTYSYQMFICVNYLSGNSNENRPGKNIS
jgi:hypothetical protein